jgi:hypothetical protein
VSRYGFGSGNERSVGKASIARSMEAWISPKLYFAAVGRLVANGQVGRSHGQGGEVFLARSDQLGTGPMKNLERLPALWALRFLVIGLAVTPPAPHGRSQSLALSASPGSTGIFLYYPTSDRLYRS